MASDMEFRADLYRATAADYDRFRPAYPSALLDDLRHRLPVSGTGRLLDLACGTGQLALPLAGVFAEVVAVDQEPESVAYAEAKATAAEATNVTWVAGAAETVDVAGPFELITVGTAFHRLDRSVVARRMRSWVQADGGVALVWSDVPSRGDRPWQEALRELMAEWMAKAGTTDRLPGGWEEAMAREPHERVLRQAGFDYAGKFEFTVDQTWTAETLVGFVYSTSILSRLALGARAGEFEHELADRLGPLAPDGVFRQTAIHAYELARPASPPA